MAPRPRPAPVPTAPPAATAALRMRAGQDPFRAVFLAEPECVKLVAEDGTVLEMNPAGLAMLEADHPEQVLGQSVFSVIAPEDVAAFRELHEAVFRGEARVLEFDILGFKGTRRRMETHAVPLRNASGEISAHLAVARDITRPRLAEDALRRSEARLRLITEQVPAILWTTDRDLQITSSVGAGLAVFGLAQNQLVGTTILEYFGTKDLDNPRVTPVLRALAGESASDEAVLGGRLWEVHLEPLRDAERRIIGTIGLAVDVTEIRRAREALREREALLGVMIGQLPAIIWTTDRELCITSSLGAGLAQLRLRQDELVGSRLQDYLQSDDPGFPPVASHRQALEGHSAHYDTEWQGRTFNVHVDPLREPDGRIVGTVGLAFDITERTRAETSLRASEQRFRGIFDHAAVGICLVNLEGRPVEANRAYEEMFGYSLDELRRMRFKDYTHPDDVAVDMVALPEMAAGRRSLFQREKRYIRKDGAVVWGHVTVSVVRDAGGAPQFFIAMVENITERKRAEEALRASETRFRGVFDHAAIGISIVNLEGRLLEANRALQELLGYTLEELRRMRFADFTHPDDLPRDLAALQEIRDGRRDLFQREKRYIRKDGTVVWVHLTVSVVHDAAGSPQYVIAMVENVTERKRAEEAIRSSERRLRRQAETLVDLAQVQVPRAEDLSHALRRITETAAHTLEVERAGIWLYDADRSAIRCRDLFTRSTGEHSTGGSLEAERYPAYFRALDEDRAIDAHDARADPRTSKFSESYLAPHGITSMLDAPIRAGGRVIGVLCHEHVGPPRRWTLEEVHFAGSLADFVSLALEAHERRRAEEALRDSEGRYRLLFDSNPHPMWVYDVESLRFLAVNDAAVQHYGFSREEFLSMTAKEIRPPEEVARLLEALTQAGGEPIQFGLWRHRKKDGTPVDMEVSSRPIVFAGRPARLALGHDVTERRRLEAQLLQAQKMETVGRLAGGVAHDFNNLLMAIVGYAQLGSRSLAPDDPVSGYLREVLRACERAANLTRQLLAFSRRQIIEPRVLNLNEVILGMDGMLRRLIGEDIDLETAPDPALGWVKVDPGQMEQVLVNLAVNARDAMPQGGKLRIETADVEGGFVAVSVRDTGVGMTDEVRAHLFEPFFTTKERGKGTGLGLATCYGIIKQCGGHIQVESAPGQGTSLRIFLPSVAGPGEAASRSPDSGESLRGTETVFLVEDEPSVRALTARALREHGYTVIQASHGEEALRKIQEHGEGRIHLLVTDVIMPYMGGKELAERLTALRPGLRILFVSGYTDDELAPRGVEGLGSAFLQKPFSGEEFLRKVREVLRS